MNNENEPEQTRSTTEEAQASVVNLTIPSKPQHILDSLIHDLNNLILVYISAIYYFDCFSLLLLLRFIGQTQSLNTGVRFVLTANTICLLTHVFHSLPQPAPREFWNHGGALVDFIGEKPISRFKLILLDLLVLSLQILYLALHYKRSAIDPSSEPKPPTPVQDLEAEEAGFSRANPPTQVETEEGVELENLLLSGRRGSAVSTGHASHADNVIILQKKDFKEVFLKSAHNAQSDESTAAVRRFFARVQQVRAQRAAQEANVQPNAAVG